jgi:DNA invertase Pin-like site-specific DNA recombinase
MDNNIEKITSQYAQNPLTMKIERVAAYVRVSHQEQKLHGLSLDAQRMKLTEYAEKNGMKIVEWYVDEGVSGRKLIRNRPELQRMIQDAEKGNFERIIFIKLDRFFRSVAEYHECMKRIAPVVWSTTEEEYDLATANGRMLVNMKLTIAEMEADQTGERIKIVNDYKVQTGQPLYGDQCMPFGFCIAKDEKTGRKKIIRNPEEEDILNDAISHYLLHQNKRKTLIYLHTKYHIGLSYNSLTLLLKNTMLYGAYRDNPAYCEAYISKEEFDRMQEIMSRNGKLNTAPNREYLFSGLIKCPCCNTHLTGGTSVNKRKDKVVRYKKYRCAKWRTAKNCEFNKAISEKSFERMMIANIEKYLEEAKLRAAEISDSEKVKVSRYNIDDIHEEIDRLNYSWQTGKIRKVEQYEKDYAGLIQKLEAAEAEQGKVAVKDFSKIEGILHDGWKVIYNNLDEAHRKAFWRSFIRSIEINWTTENKTVTRVNFF